MISIAKFINDVNSGAFTQDQLINFLNSLRTDKWSLEKGYFVPPADLPKFSPKDDWYFRRFDITWYAKWQRRKLVRQRLIAVNAAIAEVTAKLRALGMSEEELKKNWITAVKK